MAQKIQGKQITPEFPDDEFRIQDNADATKELAFELSGVTTATTRTITVQDSDGTLAYLSDITGGIQSYDGIVDGVGTDPDTYANIKAAIDAGKRRLAIIADCTETASFSTGTGGVVYIKSFEAFGRPTVTLNSGVTITIDSTGELTLEGLNLVHTGTSDGIIGTNSTSQFIARDCDFTTTGSGVAEILDSNGSAYISDCRIDIGTTARGFSAGLLHVDNCEFVGTGGAGYAIFVSSSQYARVSNCHFTGTWASSLMFSISSGRATFSNITFQLTGTFTVDFGPATTVDGMTVTTFSGTQSFSGGSISNALLGGQTLRTRGFEQQHFSNIRNIGNMTFTSGSQNCMFSNCEYTGSITLSSDIDECTWVGCTFANPVVVSSGSNSHTFSASRFEGTLTINATSSNTLLVGCTFESTFTDNGSNTVIRGCIPDSDNNPTSKSQWEATVNTSGADYTTVQAALAAGYRNILVLGGVTETTDWVLSANTQYRIRGQASDFNPPELLSFSDGVNVTLASNTWLQLENLDFHYTRTSAPLALFVGTGDSTQKIVFKNCEMLNNTTTQANSYMIDNCRFEMYDCELEVNSANGSGLDLDVDCVMKNVTISTNGTGGNNFINFKSGTHKLHNVTLGGAWSTGTLIDSTGGSQFVSDSDFTIGSNVTIEVAGFWSNTAFSVGGTGSIVLGISGSTNTYLSNCTFSDSPVQMIARSGATASSMVGCANIGDFTWNSDVGSNHKFSGCGFNGTVTVEGDEHMFSGCYFAGAVTVNDSADINNVFVGCRFDSTVTDNGSNTIIRGCSPDSENNPTAAAQVTFDASAKLTNFTAVSNTIYKVDVNTTGSVVCTMPAAASSTDGDIIRLYVTVPDATNTLTFAAGTGSALQTLNNDTISVGDVEGTAIDWVSDGTDWYCMNIYG